MADPLNASFEIAGSNPGDAQDWTITISFAGWKIADFSGGVGNPRPLESFEQSPYVRTVVGGVGSIFDTDSLAIDPSPIESFNAWTGNEYYHRTVNAGTVATFVGGAHLESFEASAPGYVTTVSGGASFFSSFEEAAAGYVTTVSGGTPALFNSSSGPLPLETFESTQHDQVFSVPTPWTNTLVTTNVHTLHDNDRVTILSTGSPPGGLTTNAVYYVYQRSSFGLKLSLAPGGPAIATTSPGVGTHRIHSDETVYWTDGP